MKLLDELEARQRERAAENRRTLPPAVLAFADTIRKVFGDAVRLKTGKDWPGGSNVKGKRRARVVGV